MQSIDQSTSRQSTRTLGLTFTTALAAVLLAGCAGNVMSRAHVSAETAPSAVDDRQNRAIALAEAAVLASPRSATHRLTLGNAYLDAGRFASAESAFTDAMTLGETSPRAALSLALSKIAQQDYAAGAALLNEWDGAIAKADLGLALALAGQPERGIHIMSNAIRGGENTVKMRQNLAYAFAIAGRWREARLMAQQDLPAGEVAARMEHWAAMASADAYQQRIAGLLQVPSGIRDTGQPVQLALASTPAMDPQASQVVELAALAEPAAPQIATASELAAFEQATMGGSETKAATPSDLPSAVLTTADSAELASARRGEALGAFTDAFAQPHTSGPQDLRITDGSARVQFISSPVVQKLPAGPVRSAAASTARAPAGESTHLIQLGSFASERGAERAWDIYVARYPELAGHEVVISEAVVRGKRFWRVSAGGFDRADSHAMCRRVRSDNGDGCVTWAATSPLPGAVESGLRLARR